jgi:hypothetical protein
MSSDGCSPSWSRLTTATRRPWTRFGRVCRSSSRCTRRPRRRSSTRRWSEAGAEEETLDAIKDHNEIRDTISVVARHEVGTPGWRDAVAAVNVANGDHMAEEEREGLTDFRRTVTLDVRHDLGVQFIRLESRNYQHVLPIDRDPATYVHEVEEAVAG